MMKLIKNKRNWLSFLRHTVCMDPAELKRRESWASPDHAPTFPCFAYAELYSFQYEEFRPVYISIPQLKEYLAMAEGLQVSL